VAGREKDLDFARDMASLGLVHRDELLTRLESVSCIDEHRRQFTARVHPLFR
jgi:hypothetical protein